MCNKSLRVLFKKIQSDLDLILAALPKVKSMVPSYVLLQILQFIGGGGRFCESGRLSG